MNHYRVTWIDQDGRVQSSIVESYDIVSAISGASTPIDHQPGVSTCGGQVYGCAIVKVELMLEDPNN